jgi:hypothetical protein
MRKRYAAVVFWGALTSTTSQAMPAVGDSASYIGTYSGGKYTQEQSLVSFNTLTKQFTQHTVQADEGKSPQSYNMEVDAESLPSEANMGDLLGHCEAQSGVRERIHVIAGTFDTCKLPQGSGSGWVWMAMIPFGLVKADSQSRSGEQSKMELTSFTQAH